jgi:hypothetical protein
MKFRLIKDLITNTGFEEIKLYDKGTIFTPNNEGNYEFVSNDGKIKIQSKEDLLDKKNLFEYLPEIELKVKELEIEEDDIVKNYRIQLDIKTSFRKLKEIEKFLKENVNEML